MSFLDYFKSKPKIIDNVFDKDDGLLVKVGGYFNDLSLSEPERIKFDLESANAVINYSIMTMEESTDRSKSRRDAADKWFTMQVWLIKMLVLTVFLDHLAILLKAQTGYDLFDQLIKVALNPWICGITGVISVFFWGSHALRVKLSGAAK